MTGEQRRTADILGALDFSRREWSHFAIQFGVLSVPVVLTLIGGLSPDAAVILFLIEGQLALLLTQRLRVRHRDSTRALGHYIDAAGRLPARHPLHPSTDWPAVGVRLAVFLSLAVLGFTLLNIVLDARTTSNPSPLNREFVVALAWMVGLTVAEWGYDRYRTPAQPYLWVRNRMRAAFARLGVMCLYLIAAFVLFSGTVMAYVGMLAFVAARALTEVVLINARETPTGELPIWMRLLHSDQEDDKREAEFERWRSAAGDRERFTTLSELAVPPELFSSRDEAVLAWAREAGIPIQGEAGEAGAGT